MSDENRLVDTPPAFAGLVGVARRDITPPVGIYARLWGAAKHDRAEGIHRPMTATAIAIAGEDDASSPAVLIALDLSHFQNVADDLDVRSGICAATGVAEDRLAIACSHTHSSPWIGQDRESLPGGDMLPAYRTLIRDRAIEAATEAIANMTAATITCATGRATLATNRDLRDPDPQADRFICGYNPEADADDTLLVGRITRDSDDAVIGTIVNYACHPTTLAWENTQISPDYIGAMRELVEGATGGAPCAFLQGASGELSPAHQYVGDVAVADRGGRSLGYAVLSTLELMLPPKQRLAYQGVMESGAPLAVWRPEAFEPSRAFATARVTIDLPMKKLPTPEELTKQMEAAADRAMAERLRRKAQVMKNLGGGPTAALPVVVWRLGDIVLLGQRTEAYSCFQQAVRAAFPRQAILAAGLVNGAIGYVYPPQFAELNLYQAWQSPFAPEALEVLQRSCETQISQMLGDTAATPR